MYLFPRAIALEIYIFFKIFLTFVLRICWLQAAAVLLDGDSPSDQAHAEEERDFEESSTEGNAEGPAPNDPSRKSLCIHHYSYKFVCVSCNKWPSYSQRISMRFAIRNTQHK